MTHPRTLAISSFVAHGSVGLRAVGPALESLSCEVMQIPTVMLSNHPGHAHTAGRQMDPSLVQDTIRALDANGWLAGLSAVISGYLPTARHVEAYRDAIVVARQRTPGVPYVLDPILGDDPKGLYIEESAAQALRNLLLPLASAITPNRFELQWLTGLPVTSVPEAIAAARTLSVPVVAATSIPAPNDHVATVLVTADQTVTLSLARRQRVPHGTGDLLAGLLTGHLARGTSVTQAFLAAHAALEQVISASAGSDLLDLSSLTARANLP